ncbi:GntR family transcriptional regulator [Nocardia sp. CA-120079]|uniref:GntR family transcriptional regulator n=1 Tax=Nocardia sp. CA-120079 TaxID=3239974 RepID=UPI003D98C686
MSTALYEAVKERLLAGRYAAGEKIVVEALREEFGVSKQPVMEALRRLSSDHLVRIIPQVGCEVARYSAQEVDDFFLLFGGTEGAIAAVAAARRTEAQLHQLRQMTDSADHLVESVDPRDRAHGYLVHNREFHAAIHAMAHSRIMAETSQRLWDMSDFLISTAGVENPLADAIPHRQRDHHQILDAIADQDALAARQAMEEHITGTIRIIRDGGGD